VAAPACGGGADLKKILPAPLMTPASVSSPAIAARINVFALALACVCATTLAFHHTIALRLYAMGAAAALTFAAGGWRELRTLPLRNAWIAWAVVAAISVALAHDRHALDEFSHEVVYTFAAFATWYFLARRAGGARWLAYTLMGVLIAVLALGTLRYARVSTWFDLGEYGDVGSLSTFFVTILPLLLFLALHSRAHSAERIGAVALVAGCLTAGFLTLNRMFWFAAAAEIMIFAMSSMRYWQTSRRELWMAGVVAIVAVLAITEVLLASQSRIALAAPGTGIWDFVVEDPRGDLWRFAARAIAEHPLLGTGIGKWSSRALFDAQFHDPMLLHAHNMFLNRALETGLPGLAAFVVLLGAVAIAFRRMARSDDTVTAAIGAAGLALVFGVVLKNLTDDFFIRQNAMLFWSLTGAALGAGAARQDRAPTAARSP
jgi:O-antigen ligase